MTANSYITGEVKRLDPLGSCIIDIEDKSNRKVQSFVHMVAQRNGFKLKTKKIQGNGILVTRIL